jgi:hypothetical protein
MKWAVILWEQEGGCTQNSPSWIMLACVDYEHSCSILSLTRVQGMALNGGNGRWDLMSLGLEGHGTVRRSDVQRGPNSARTVTSALVHH